MPGKFITLEGIEGSGKTTQARLLADRLQELGHEVLLTREPGGTELGQAIREMLKRTIPDEPVVPEAEMLLFEASRAQLVRLAIMPALEAGSIVVSDRFTDSTTVYQGCARGLDKAAVGTVSKFATGSLVPDLTILLDVDVTTGLSRIAARNIETGSESDRIEREARSFHEKVRSGYLAIAEAEPARVKVLDGSRDESQVVDDVWRSIQNVL